jgi:molecular chaperone IbpA|tara:strand:- start:266 stop:703 length:438 start_codon:yes stop_codon:yes gene_type:complete
MGGNLTVNIPFKNFFNFVRPFSIGFDSLFAEFDRMLDSPEFTGNYPSYNIKQINKKNISVEVDVANFNKKDIQVETTKNFLTIRGGNKKGKSVVNNTEENQFIRSFALTDNVKVKKAGIKKGLLTINLQRELPKKIEKPSIVKIH